MNFKKYIIMFLAVILSTSTFSMLNIKLLSNSINEKEKIYNYEVHTDLYKNPIVRNFQLKVENKKNKTIKTLYTYRNVFDNKDKFVADDKPIYEKVYEMVIKFDKKGRLKETYEKSYVISLEEMDMMMYIPIKKIKSTYKYYSEKEKKKLKTDKTGTVKYEKAYNKIYFGSGEKSSENIEKLIKYLVPESKIDDYNVLDLGILREEIENKDEEEIFLRGSVTF